MRVSVGTASDLVIYEALVATHVLRMLGRGESEGVHVHSIRVTGWGGQGLVSSRGNIGMVPRPQLLESLGDIVELASLGKPVLVRLWLVFQRCHLEGQVSQHCLP